MKFTKRNIYISLFGILYLIVAFSSFFHACAFFGLANNSWMSIILAFAFEVGQAAVLFSLLTSTKDRSRIMPWVLMTMFTLVQVIGNVYSSYKYIILNSVENLRYFKEPIFIWTDLPDEQANVIIVYLVGALLPIAALLLTSMITNYLTDQSEENNKQVSNTKQEITNKEESITITNENDSEIIEPENEQQIKDLNESLTNKDEEISNLKKQLDELNQLKQQNFTEENPIINEEINVETNTDNENNLEQSNDQVNEEIELPQEIENNEFDDELLKKQHKTIKQEESKKIKEMTPEEIEEERRRRASKFINL